jgi:HK97 family phage major capsid protein/HK97 family phage prohead protease
MPDGSILSRDAKARQVLAYQGKDPWTFVASTEAVDRYGDIIVADGWDLRNFKKNPIALWQHNASQPIGNWEDVRVEDGALIARLNMVKPGVSVIADMLRGMIEQRVLRAVSVGFMPLKAEPIMDAKGNPTGGLRFLKSELLEISVVSVPANPEALSVARTLGASPEVLNVIFAKTGDTRREGNGRSSGLPARSASNSNKGTTTMPTLAERITAKEAEIATLRDTITNLSGAEGEDNETALAEATDKLERETASLASLKRAQAALAASAAPAGEEGETTGSDAPKVKGSPSAPATIRARGNTDPVRNLVRAAIAIGKSHVEKRTLDDVIRANFNGAKDIETLVRAATDPATVGASAWAGLLVDETMGAFVDVLRDVSVFFGLSAQEYVFTANGSIKLPSRASGTLAGGFLGEGAPIPVKSVGLASTSLMPYKMGVITTFTREIMMQSSVAIEPLLRNMMIEDTRDTIDTLFMDNVALSAGVRPAGLQNLAGANTDASGGTTLADVIADLKAAVAAFGTNKMGTRLTWIMDKQRMVSLSLMTNAAGNFMFRDEVMNGTLLGIPVITSTNVPDDVVFLVDAAELARAASQMPMIDISEQATLHMDTAPSAIGTVGTPNVVAAPVRSLWQTASMGLRLLWDVSWNQRRANAVYTITGVAW